MKLICGDTGKGNSTVQLSVHIPLTCTAMLFVGVFKSTQVFDVYVDIQNVVELTQISVSPVM